MKNALYIASAGLLFLFLLLNIAASQSVSPLYFDLASRNPQAAVSFLEYIKHLPDFSFYQSQFDTNVQHRFIVEEARQAAEIKRLEQLLERNPDARDVLYNLYLLYNRVGNNEKAQEYLKRAQEVDPTIK